MKLPKEVHETNFEFVDIDDTACFSSNDYRWVKKILKLVEKYPEQTKLVTNDEYGFVTIRCPKSWFNVKPPAKRNFTEEQRRAMSDRMKAMAKARAQKRMEANADG